MNEEVHFIRRIFPSANMVLVTGPRPVLIDTGFGSALQETLSLLRAHDVAPESLSLIVNTHYHSDHVGGNHGLQTGCGVPVAAHPWEAAMINRRDPESCSGRWLDQPVEPYTVDRLLHEGDVVETGSVALEVFHTPGHTLGHLSLFDRKSKRLICGDAVHADDVCWINFFREGAGAIERAMDSVERLRRLEAVWFCSGHGPDTDDPEAAFTSALDRYEKWVRDPEKAGWHACKRIFAYKLMICGGLARNAVAAYLIGCPWFLDYSRHVFDSAPEDFAAPMIEEMVRSKAARWRGDWLVPGAPHTPPEEDWLSAPGDPARWPAE